MLRNLAVHLPNNPYHFCGHYQAPPALGVVRNSVSFQCRLWVLTPESQCHFLEATKKGSKISCWVEQSPEKCGSCLTFLLEVNLLEGRIHILHLVQAGSVLCTELIVKTY